VRNRAPNLVSALRTSLLARERLLRPADLARALALAWPASVGDGCAVTLHHDVAAAKIVHQKALG
jgi:hypothetical protein